MPADDRQREYRREMLLASMLIAAGLAISALALTALTHSEPPQIAQATPPTQSTPGAETKPSAPSEPATTGQRPSDIPPQPARPDAGRAEGGRSARAAARAGGEDCAADPREIIPRPPRRLCNRKIRGPAKPAVRVLTHLMCGMCPSAVSICMRGRRRRLRTPCVDPQQAVRLAAITAGSSKNSRQLRE